MIDLHTHILYGWDDGAETLAESFAMASLAAEDGTRVIAATPHFISGGERVDNDIVRERVAEINGVVERAGIDIRIVTGCEVPATWENLALIKHGKVLLLGDSRTLLLEVPFRQHPVQFKDLIYQVRLLGITPLLAHPERSDPFLRDHDLFRRTVDLDVPVQITSTCIVGDYGKRYQDFAWEILREERPIVVASDGHHAEYRRPMLGGAHTAIAGAFGQEAADLMCRDNPAALLEGRPPRVASIPRPASKSERSSLRGIVRRALGRKG